MNASRERDPAQDPLTAYNDLHGLAVHDTDDLLTGHVHGILSEAETGLVRFLDIELDGKNRHVLVPIGHARLEASAIGPRIRLRAASLQDLQEVPPYEQEGAWPNHDTTREVLAAHGRSFRGDKYYAHPAYDHRGLYAGEHPIIKDEVIPEGNAVLVGNVTGLQSLSQLPDYRVAHGEHDVRGWTVVDAGGNAAGVADDLLVDLDNMKVRYAVVRRVDGREALVPIGYLEVRSGQHQLVAPGLMLQDLDKLRVFDGLPLSREEEEALRTDIERLLDARNPFSRVDFSYREQGA